MREGKSDVMKGNSIKKRSEKEQLNKESVRQDRDRGGRKVKCCGCL